jgi:ATP-binding cassette subfamily F protein 3
LLTEEKELNAKLEAMEKAAPTPVEGEDEPENAKAAEAEKDDISARLGELQKKLVDMEAETGPARAALLLAGLGFAESDQKLPTRSFSGGWRMRLALARALFVKPDVRLFSRA